MFTVSKLLVLIAVLCAAGAVMAILFGISNPDVYPTALALSLAAGWASFLVP